MRPLPVQSLRVLGENVSTSIPAGKCPPRPRGGQSLSRRTLTTLGDWGPALPFLIIVGGLLVGAALWLVQASFRSPSTGEWNLDAWRQAFAPGPLYRGAIVNSLVIATLTATICTAIGTPLAWFVHHLAGKQRAIAVSMMNTGANFVGISLAQAFVATLGVSGFVTKILADAGIQWGDGLYQMRGLVAMYCYFTLPLYVLLVLPAMGAIKANWWEAVQVSAGSRWIYWRRVGLPVLAPFIMSGWVLTFAWSIGQFSVLDALLSTSGEQFITIRIGNLINAGVVFGDQSQLAAAYSVLLMLISLLALSAYQILSYRPLKRLQES